MSVALIEKSIQTAAASLQMEGLSVKHEYVDLCRLMLAGEITMEQYLARVTPHEVKNDAV